MSGHKQLEKQLKRPDSFQANILKAIDYVKNNPSRVAMMLAPLLVIGLAAYGIHSWQQRQSANRRAAIAKIFTMQTAENSAAGKKNESIQKEIDALRNVKPDAAGKKPEVSADTLLKIAALEKQLTVTKPDHSASTAEFLKFYEANKSNTEGWLAGISWAGEQLDQGKIAETRPIIEEISKASINQKYYQIQSRFILANILEEVGEFDAALKEADILANLVSDEDKPMILLLKGRLLYFKKDAGARAVLSEIVDKHGSTREAQTARSLLAELGPA